MPSFPPSVRPVLAALLTALLMASSVLVSASATPISAANGAGIPAPVEAPAAPQEPTVDEPVSMDLVSLTPTSLAPGGTLEAQVEVTNTSSSPLSTVALELRTRTSRVTDRTMVADWQADSTPDTTGTALSSSTELPQLEPGDSATLTVQASAEDLDYSEEPYYWGTRRVSLTVVSEEEPLSAIRSFVVWRPEDADATITQSVLLPVADLDASAPVTAPNAYAESAQSGRLASLQQIALRGDVDWWLDPALLDPPQLPVETEQGADGGDDDEPVTQPLREYEVPAHAAEIATALDDGVGERTVLAMPYAQADLVSIQEADATGIQSAVQERSRVTWDEAGILPRASAMRVEGPSATATTLQSQIDAGATAAIVPSASLREDPDASVTPSGIGVFESADHSGSQLPLLAPDPELSAEFSQLTAGSDTDTEQTRQRLLAETATIASEYTTAPRHILIAPDPQAQLDAAAAGSALDALAEAPWIEAGHTSALLDAADQQAWTTDAQDDSGELFAVGRVGADSIRASGPAEGGRWQHLPEAEKPELLDPEVLTDLEGTWEQLDTLGSVMGDDALLDALRLEVLAGTSVRWRGTPDVPVERAQDAATLAADIQGRIQVVPASGYNLISDSAGVPITVINGLDTPITVRTEVTSDRPLVQVGEEPLVEVPARGQVDTTVPVEAIANGTVTLTTVLTSEDGRPLTEPVEVPLAVNPAWENWTTMLLVIAMGVLVVVGVARARKTGAATRAPAVSGPEDPIELSRSGRSAPATGATESVTPVKADAADASPETHHDPPSDPEPDHPEEESR